MRQVSGLERVWLAARKVAPPFANQLVLEGTGVPEPRDGWEPILEALATAQPGCTARLGGVLGAMRWKRGGPLPSVRVLDGSGWDGRGPGGAPFLERPIDPRRGPLYEILILEGDPVRVVLRSLNAATDGTGMLLFARGLFALLRGEEPPRADGGPQTDEQLARSLQVEPAPPPPHDSAAPTDQADPGELSCTWTRTRVPGDRDIVPALAIALARAAPQARTFRVDIPVDLRRWAPQTRSSANLTGWMQIPVHIHLGAPDPVQAVRYVIRDGLQRKAAASHVLGAGFARSMPQPLLVWMGRRLARRSLAEGQYGTSAVISHLGRIDPAELSGAGFRAARAFFVPPGSPGQPVFITTTTGPEGTELCLAMPTALASRGRLQKLMDHIRRELVRQS